MQSLRMISLVVLLICCVSVRAAEPVVAASATGATVTADGKIKLAAAVSPKTIPGTVSRGLNYQTLARINAEKQAHGETTSRDWLLGGKNFNCD